jgi:hypothetical protein
MVIVDKKNALFDKKISISMVVISPPFSAKKLENAVRTWANLDFSV